MYTLSKNMVLLKNNFRNLICLQTLVPFSSTVIQNPTSHINNNLLVDHFMNSFGFTRENAITTSKLYPSTITPKDLTSVPNLLNQSGFSDTHIRNLILRLPKFLSINADKILKPKILLLQELGFSGSDLADLILNNPSILIRGMESYLIPTIDFLRTLLHSNENIVKALKRSSWLLSFDYRKTIGSNVDILRRCKVSDDQIFKLLLKQPRFFTQSPVWFEDHVAQVEKFGVSKDSRLFIYAVYALSTMSKVTLEGKFEIYRSFGWSESDIVSAFRKAPNFLMYSEEKVRGSMRFYLESFGFEQKDLVLRPRFLSYSLEKRLKPRYEVLKILRSRGLIKSEHKLVTFVDMSEERFMKQYVLKYVKTAPDLQEVYKISSFESEQKEKETKMEK